MANNLIGGNNMSLRIYAQKKQDGSEYFFVNIKVKDTTQEELREYWNKIYVKFPQDKEPILGHLTVTDFGIGANKNKKEDGTEIMAYSIFLKEYTKTEQDLDADNVYLGAGGSFIREYHEPRKREQNPKESENLHSNLVDFTKTEDLPF